MAETSSKTGGKKLKLDDSDKNSDFPPPTIKSTQETKDVCGDCKIHKDTIENLTAHNSKLENIIEKLREVINDLLVETGRHPDLFDHLLTLGQSGENEGTFSKNLQEVAEKNAAARTALSNSVILRKVFGYFRKSSVLKLRTVCKHWAEEAATCLLKKRVRIRLFYNREENTLGKNGVGMLPDLTNVMTTCVREGRKFPCVRFKMVCSSLMTVPDVQVFLQKCGFMIEELYLEFLRLPGLPEANQGLTESLKNLLFDWAPNLKVFNVVADSWSFDNLGSLVEENEDDPASSSLALPNLEVVSWFNNSSGQLYQDLLRISPNLKKVSTNPCYFGLEQVVQANKAGALKALQFEFGYTAASASSIFMLTSEHCFQVEEIKVEYHISAACNRNTNVLSFPDVWRSNVQLLNTVFRNNRNCLKKLQFQNWGPLAECGLEIPIMPNIKILDITTLFNAKLLTAQNLEVQTFFRIFPKGLDVASTFPNLAHISWKIHLNDDSFDDAGAHNAPFLNIPMMETLGPLISVRSLTMKINKKEDIEFFRRIAVCLPNIKVLKVDYRDRHKDFCDKEGPTFPIILRTIWMFFQSLERIHLLPYVEDLPKSAFVSTATPAQFVDSAVTGLDLTTVKKLAGIRWTKSEFGGEIENSASVEAPSILNMKSLRYLKISIQSVNDYPIFTHVSGTHGFGLMSNLIVVVEAEGEKKSVIEDEQGLMSQNVKFFQIPRKRESNW